MFRFPLWAARGAGKNIYTNSATGLETHGTINWESESPNSTMCEIRRILHPLALGPKPEVPGVPGPAIHVLWREVCVSGRLLHCMDRQGALDFLTTFTMESVLNQRLRFLVVGSIETKLSWNLIGSCLPYSPPLSPPPPPQSPVCIKGLNCDPPS